MESILFTQLNANEQETLQGGGGYSYPDFYNVPQNNNIADSAASTSSSQTQQAQQQGLLSQTLGLLK